MKKLIFVEGVSGVGKSTLTVKLRDALIAHGFRAVCHLEGDADNPVDLFCCAYLTKTEFFQLLQDYPIDKDTLIENSVQEADYVLVRYGDCNTAFFVPTLFDVLKSHEGFYKPANPININQYTQVFADCWRRFLCQNQGNTDYVIFDGGFLFHRANDLIQNYQATDETIARHLIALLSAMSPHSPILFYLSAKDVGARLIQARESRGQTPATEVQIAFELERKHRQMQILNILPVQTCIIDISNGWENAIENMIGLINDDEGGLKK
ncbi:MAG TPA: hypothetical protein DD640_08330 [Clostridiales bacterium]|nr:hypothetical protein [Clostridiales bacterium]